LAGFRVDPAAAHHLLRLLHAALRRLEAAMHDGPAWRGLRRDRALREPRAIGLVECFPLREPLWRGRAHLVLLPLRALLVDALEPAHELLLMVAHDHENVAAFGERAHLTHHAHRIRAAIHEVAHEHQPILARDVAHRREKLTKLLQTAMHVTNRERPTHHAPSIALG